MRAFISIDSTLKSSFKIIQSNILKTIELNQNIIRPVQEQNLHFTIFFLGEVDLETLTNIKSKLSEIYFNPIKLNYEGIGVFPSFKFPKILWIGVDKDSELALCKIYDMIYSKMKDLGFKQDKKYVPHLTLFRIKRQVPELSKMEILLKKYQNRNFGSEIINSIDLQQSELTSAGPKYSKLNTIYAKVS